MAAPPHRERSSARGGEALPRKDLATMFRPTYTKPLPLGAEIVTHKGRPHAKLKGDDGKTVLAPLTADGTRCRIKAAKWYGRVPGNPKPVPLCTDKTAAQQMLAELIKKAELGRVGISDPFEEHRQRPLAEHLADWEASLRAGGATAKHVRQTVACARRVVEGCRFVFPADLSASRVQQYLAGLRERRPVRLPPDPDRQSYTKAELAGLLGVKPSAVPSLVCRHRLEATGYGKARRYPRATAEALVTLRTRGRSIKTSNLYLDAIKQFAAWLVQDRRLPDNLLAHLAGGNVKLDRRHDRRALPLDELRAVLQAARRSAVSFRGLTGLDRAMLYSVACASGFRASELASLRPEAFALDDSPPTVTLSAQQAKNGKTAVQPLPPDVAEALRGYLAGRPASEAVWPGNWADNAADMVRIDLDAAGVPYAVEGPDGPRFADFHALRHSYVALLDRSGATLKEAMQLARHSDPKLTMAVYGRAHLHDLGEAVRRLPGLLEGGRPEAEAVRATDTEWHRAPAGEESVQGGAASAPKADAACTNLVQANDAGYGSLRLVDAPEGSEVENATGLNSLVPKEVEAGGDSLIPPEESSPTRTRTWNKPVNRTLLVPAEKRQKYRVRKGLYASEASLQARLSACVDLREFTVLPARIR
jgi:integrase